MNLHEYQAKQLTAHFGLPAPRGQVVAAPEEFAGALAKVQGPPWVIKAQIKAGGRGKAGGVKIVGSAQDAEAAVRGLLNHTLVTHQTGPDGLLVKRVLIES